jgi:hypothetical protein
VEEDVCVLRRLIVTFKLTARQRFGKLIIDYKRYISANYKKLEPADIKHAEETFVSDILAIITQNFVTGVELSVAPAGLNVSYAINGRTVKIWAYGGTNGVTYKVTALVSSNGGRIREAEIKIKVVDE